MNTLDTLTQQAVVDEIVEQLQGTVHLNVFHTRHYDLPECPSEMTIEIANEDPIWVEMPDSEWIPRRIHFGACDERLVAQLDGYLVPNNYHRRPGLTYAVDFDR